jgi:hypothetical protein
MLQRFEAPCVFSEENLVSVLGLSIVCVVGAIPASFLADCPYWACRGKFRTYVREGVVDLVTLMLVLTLAKQVDSTPIAIAGLMSVGLFSIKMVRGLSTCFSGVEVAQPNTPLGELWLCCSALVGMGVLALGMLAPFFRNF